MLRRLLCLLVGLVGCLTLQAQVDIDHLSLLPDDLDIDRDSVVLVVEQVAAILAPDSTAEQTDGAVEQIDSNLVAADSTIVQTEAEPVVEAQNDSLIQASSAMLDYVSRKVYRSWRHLHPVKRLSGRIPTYSGFARQKVDSLHSVVDALPFNTSSEDMLYLYDMRLPIINSGLVPADSLSHYYEQTQELEQRDDTEQWHIGYYDQQYRRQRFNEEQRHLVRFRYASSDPRRFRYARRHFDVPTGDGQTLDTKTTVQQTRIGDDLDIDFGKADLESFGQYFELKADKWHWKGDHTLTLQQTALSSNWYKDGDNNMSISGNQKFTVTRYDEEAKTTFEGVLDLKLSGYYTKADTIHNMKVSDNELSLTLKYGYKAWKKWYYSGQIYAKTPVFDYYKPNSSVCKSTFLSPLELNVSLGVDYQYTSPNKRFTYSLLLAPVSYDLKAVRDDRIKVTDYGIPEGDVTMHKIGSSITTKFEWKMSDNASWSSRLYYFTPYTSLQVEFENTFNFKISRFFTARIYAYPRFDDSRDTETEFKEMLTVGFSYQW